MSENTATTEYFTTDENENTESAPVETAKPKVVELANVELSDELPDNDATAKSMLSKLYTIYNKVTDLVRDHRAHDKGDDAVKELLSTPEQFSQHPELAEALSKLERAREAVKRFTELANTLATDIVAADSDDDFDADKSRQDIAALRKEGTDLYRTVLDIFEFSDKVTVVTNDAGKTEDVISEGPWGDALELVSKFPNVRGTRGAAPAGNSESAKIRDWAKENGFPVSDRGRINSEVIAAYEAAHKA